MKNRSLFSFWHGYTFRATGLVSRCQGCQGPPAHTRASPGRWERFGKGPPGGTGGSVTRDRHAGRGPWALRAPPGDESAHGACGARNACLGNRSKRPRSSPVCPAGGDCELTGLRCGRPGQACRLPPRAPLPPAGPGLGAALCPCTARQHRPAGRGACCPPITDRYPIGAGAGSGPCAETSRRDAVGAHGRGQRTGRRGAMASSASSVVRATVRAVSKRKIQATRAALTLVSVAAAAGGERSARRVSRVSWLGGRTAPRPGRAAGPLPPAPRQVLRSRGGAAGDIGTGRGRAAGPVCAVGGAACPTWRRSVGPCRGRDSARAVSRPRAGAVSPGRVPAARSGGAGSPGPGRGAATPAGASGGAAAPG